MKNLIFPFMLLTIFFLPSYNSYSHETLQDLVVKAKEYENLIYSGKATFTIRQIGMRDYVDNTHGKVTCYFEGEQYFSEQEDTMELKETGQKIHSIRKISGTPEKCEILALYENEQGLFSPHAEIYPADLNRQNENHALSYGMRINGIKISDFLQGKYVSDKNPVKSVTLIGMEKIKDYDCYVIRMDFTKNDFVVTVWLSKEHQLKPLQRIDSFTDSENKTVINYEYTLNEGIWCTKYRKAQIFDPKNELVFENIVEFTDFQVNIPISPDVFSWTLPKGVKVYDHRLAKFI